MCLIDQYHSFDGPSGQQFNNILLHFVPLSLGHVVHNLNLKTSICQFNLLRSKKHVRPVSYGIDPLCVRVHEKTALTFLPMRCGIWAVCGLRSHTAVRGLLAVG